MWKLNWSKTWKKEPVALFALLANSYFLVGRHTHGGPIGPQHPVYSLACHAGASALWCSHQPAGPGLPLGGCTLAHRWFVKKAWEALCSQQLFSLVMTALRMKTYLAGLISNLADSEEDHNSWTVSLILGPDCFLYLWVPLGGGVMLEKGLTGILYNVFLFPFPPFSSFTKC